MNCNTVVSGASPNPRRSSGPGMALQSWPELGLDLYILCMDPSLAKVFPREEKYHGEIAPIGKENSQEGFSWEPWAAQTPPAREWVSQSWKGQLGGSHSTDDSSPLYHLHLCASYNKSTPPGKNSFRILIGLFFPREAYKSTSYSNHCSQSLQHKWHLSYSSSTTHLTVLWYKQRTSWGNPHPHSWGLWASRHQAIFSPWLLYLFITETEQGSIKRRPSRPSGCYLCSSCCCHVTATLLPLDDQGQLPCQYDDSLPCLTRNPK